MKLSNIIKIIVRKKKKKKKKKIGGGEEKEKIPTGVKKKPKNY